MSIRILAIDSATEACSAALLDGDTLIQRYAISPREHTRRLLPMVDELLAEAGLRLEQMDALAFGQGPGSFTGVRIATGHIQGLAFGADCPVIGISTLAAMAQLAADEGNQRILAAIDARMGEVYWGQYQRQDNGLVQLCGEERVISPEQLVAEIQLPGDSYTGVGTGWAAYADTLTGLDASVQISEQGCYPSAAAIARLALPRHLAGDGVPAEQAMPVYLRNEVAWKKLPGR